MGANMENAYAHVLPVFCASHLYRLRSDLSFDIIAHSAGVFISVAKDLRYNLSGICKGYQPGRREKRSVAIYRVLFAG